MKVSNISQFNLNSKTKVPNQKKSNLTFDATLKIRGLSSINDSAYQLFRDNPKLLDAEIKIFNELGKILKKCKINEKSGLNANDELVISHEKGSIIGRLNLSKETQDYIARRDEKSIELEITAPFDKPEELISSLESKISSILERVKQVIKQREDAEFLTSIENKFAEINEKFGPVQSAKE